jgi:PAS domain S-box-containing protein
LEEARTNSPVQNQARRSGNGNGGPRRLGADDLGPLFENASDIVIISDRDGIVRAANRAAREFGGYGIEEVERGVSLRDMLEAHEYDAAMELTRRALDGLPIPEFYQREVHTRGIGRRVLELRSNVLEAHGGERLLQTIGRDVTEKREAEELQAATLQIAQTMLATQSLGEIGRVVCDEARNLFRIDATYLWLRREDSLAGCAAAGIGADRFEGTRYPLGPSVLQTLANATGPIIINNYQSSNLLDDAGRASGVQSFMLIPLKRGGEPHGLLTLADYHDAQRFTHTMGDRATILGAQVSAAIASVLAREREEEEGQVSAALLQVSQATSSYLSEESLLPQIAARAREAMESDWAIVALWDEEKNSFRPAATDGFAKELDDELKLVWFGPGQSEEAHALWSRRPFERSEPGGELAPLLRRWEMSSLYGTPMVRGGRIVGAFVAGFRSRRGRFSSKEKRIAVGIAAQAAVAVENARLVEALQSANALKSEFLGTMSHELRTPLNAILGYTDLMREELLGPLTEDQRQALSRMHVNSRTLLELINMTLDVNRLEVGRVAVRASRFRLGELLEEIAREVETRIDSGVAVHWPADPTALPEIDTDRGKLKIVLRNLIDNALKFTPKGSVTVGVKAGDGAVEIAVSDTGIGIAEEDIGRIFEIFHQVRGDNRSLTSGVGLGLYLVQRYCDLVGARVHVGSRLGHGSTFTVELPVRAEIAKPPMNTDEHR